LEITEIMEPIEMKSNHIVRNAVAATLMLGAAPVFAYVPTSNVDGDVIMNWSGASASTLSAMELTINAVCDANPHLLYVPIGSGGNPSEPGSDWAVACEATAGGKTGFAAGTKILVIKRDRGGSGVGVGAVQSKATDNAFGVVSGTIDFLTIGAACAAGPVPGVDGAPNIVFGAGVVPLRACPATYTSFAYAEMGTSDIEPNKFFGINTPSTGGPYRTEADRAFAKRNSLAALLFNTPVTLSLYQALQAAQFTGTPLQADCTPGGANYNAVVAVAGNIRTDITNGDSEKCMPSLTSPELSSIFGTTSTVSGISDWNRLLNSTGAQVLPAGSWPVQIARRSQGSGTQATFNALINRYPCDANASDGAIDVVVPKPIGGLITSNSDSAAVAARLQTINGNAANPYGIGILSVEGRNVNYAENWRYIKIDGVAPTLRNMHAGDYSYWAQQSCQLRSSSLPFNAQGTVAQKTVIYDKLCLPDSPNSLNKPAGLTRINNPSDAVACAGAGTDKCGSLYRFGQAGWLATPTTTLVYDNVLVASTNPVNAFTREVTAGNTSICAAPMKANAGGGAANAARGVIVAPNPEWTP
jgi:ABC-type phosphate transport system substrate-binding protein